MKRLLLISMVLALMTGFSALGPVAGAGPAERVDVCHFDADSGTFHKINISDNASDKHVAHGDGAPLEPVPGMPGYEFDADCAPVPCPQCRTYLAVGSFASSSIVLDVESSFDEAALQMTTVLSIPGGAPFGTLTYSYESLNDFVREPDTMGRTLYVEATSSGALGNTIEEYEYDAQGRLITITVDDTGPGDRDRTTVFSAWDDAGRPTEGQITVAGACDGIATTISYDDVERRRTQVNDFPACSGLERRVSWEVYDEDGIIIRQVINATETEQDVLVTTIVQTAEVCG